ncbi:hypothetical protein Tco_0001718 [Tanacetum coccineum]
MFFKLPECELDVGLKIVECDSDLEAMYEFADAYGKIEMDEAISKLRIHENRKKDVGNMSYEELVSWAKEKAQPLKTPPKPKIISKKVWDSLTPKKSDTGACGSGTNVEFIHKQSNAPKSNLNVDESIVPFEFDDGDTGASFKAVDDHTRALVEAIDDYIGPPSEAIDDLGRDKIIEEDKIVKNVVDKGKGKMIKEERPVPAKKAMVRNNVTAKRAPKISKQKPCSNKEGGEESLRLKTLYGLGETETVLEHEEFMDELVRKLRDCDDDAELINPFKLVETRVKMYPTHD